MRKIALAAGVIALFATLASAQVPTSGNIYLGYAFENTDWTGLDSSLNRPNLHGWEGSLEGKVFPHVGIVADFSQHFGSQSFNIAVPAGSGGPFTTNVTGHGWEMLFGPRLSIPVGSFTPFAEVMIGVAHISNSGVGDLPSTSNTSFGTAVGGGLDFKIVRPIAWRVEADYLQTRFYSTTQNNLRLSTGIVFRF